MTRPWASAIGAGMLAGVLLCGCGGRGDEHGAPSEATAPKNPSDFPLYRNSQVVTVVAVDSAQLIAAMRKSDPGAQIPRNYRGHEIIAETGATMPQLASWIAALKSAPPHGMRATSHGSFNLHASDGSDKGKEVAAQFESADSARSVFVIVADPRAIRATAGPLFTLIDSYGAVPGMLRGPIDDEAKRQFGYSVTELLDAKSPVGAVIAELKKLQAADRRAILVIDEAKAQ